MKSRELQGREGCRRRTVHEMRSDWMEALTENNQKKTLLQGSRKQHCHVTDRCDWSAVT